jgi:hypothetical protein
VGQWAERGREAGRYPFDDPAAGALRDRQLAIPEYESEQVHAYHATVPVRSLLPRCGQDVSVGRHLGVALARTRVGSAAVQALVVAIAVVSHGAFKSIFLQHVSFNCSV